MRPCSIPTATAPLRASWNARRRRSGRDVLLDSIERGALIFINEEDRLAIRDALNAAGRTVPEVLAEPSFPPEA